MHDLHHSLLVCRDELPDHPIFHFKVDELRFQLHFVLIRLKLVHLNDLFDACLYVELAYVLAKLV